MSEEISEFAAIAIPDDKLVPWPRVAAVAAMVAFSLPTFEMGLSLSRGLSPMPALWALIWGSVIIFVIGAAMGAIGSSSRMSSYLLARIAFGDKGASVLNIALAISLVGWFGVNINFFQDAVSGLALDVWGVTLSPLLLAIVASVCMTVTTLVGFKAINILATLLVPVLAVVTFLFAKSVFVAQPLSETLAMDLVIDKTDAITIGGGISAVVGTIIIGAIILPDITRFVRHWSGAVYIAAIAYLGVQFVVMAAACLAGAVSGKTEILDIMLDINLGIGAFIIVIAGSWVLNSLNLYSTVLSVKATFPKLKTVVVAVTLGAVGVIAALMNILDNFITFLVFLGDIFTPVAGVIMIDRFFIRPRAYTIETLQNNRAFNARGLIAWVAGASFAVLASRGIVPTLSGISVIDAVVLAGILYTALAWPHRERTAL